MEKRKTIYLKYEIAGSNSAAIRWLEEMGYEYYDTREGDKVTFYLPADIPTAELKHFLSLKKGYIFYNGFKEA